MDSQCALSRFLRERDRVVQETGNHQCLSELYSRIHDVTEASDILFDSLKGVQKSKVRKIGSAWRRAHLACLRAGQAIFQASEASDRAFHIADADDLAAQEAFLSEMRVAHAALDLATFLCGLGTGAMTEAEVRRASGRTRSEEVIARTAAREKVIAELAARANLPASAIGARRASDVGLSADRLARKIRKVRISGISN